jgi:hypothetical protein
MHYRKIALEETIHTCEYKFGAWSGVVVKALRY